MNERKNILVMGGAGFIGSQLCERLLSDNNVICVDNFITSGQSNISHLLRFPNFKFINADVNEKLDLEKMTDLDNFQIKVFGIQEIYNMACPTSVNNFDRLKRETILTNTIGLINALDLAVKYKAKFLQASSSVVYGEVGRGEYVDEKYVGKVDLLDVRACYDEGKRYAESIVSTYANIFNLETKIVRIFRTYGPKMLLDDGQMIPDFILNAIDNKDLVIYGNKDFQTSLCFVSDIIEGCINIMNSKINEPVNLGSTDVFKLVDVAQAIIDIVGSKSKIEFAESKTFMRELCLPNITKVREAIGWLPVVGLEDGLRKTIEFTQAHKELLNFSAKV
ncbi:MAG: GDP-mannose 4,6-dehydratase [Patescibacteria group bacterium]